MSKYSVIIVFIVSVLVLIPVLFLMLQRAPKWNYRKDTSDVIDSYTIADSYLCYKPYPYRLKAVVINKETIWTESKVDVILEDSSGERQTFYFYGDKGR